MYGIITEVAAGLPSTLLSLVLQLACLENTELVHLKHKAIPSCGKNEHSIINQ